MPSDPFQYEIKLKRGDGQDVQKCKVKAQTIEQLEERVEQVRERLKKWAKDYREIQPDQGRSLADDQERLGPGGAEA